MTTTISLQEELIEKLKAHNLLAQSDTLSSFNPQTVQNMLLEKCLELIDQLEIDLDDAQNRALL